MAGNMQVCERQKSWLRELAGKNSPLVPSNGQGQNRHRLVGRLEPFEHAAERSTETLECLKTIVPRQLRRECTKTIN